MPSQIPIDFTEQGRVLSSYRLKIVAHPDFWTRFRYGPLNWQRVPFTRAGRALLPQDRDVVYAFVAQPGIASGLTHFLLYVGKTTRLVSTRFGEYLREANDPFARSKIARYLRDYSTSLEFWWAPLPTTDVESVEQMLIDAFVPPANEPHTVSADIRAVVNAYD